VAPFVFGVFKKVEAKANRDQGGLLFLKNRVNQVSFIHRESLQKNYIAYKIGIIHAIKKGIYVNYLSLRR
jgi:hypothetical protein